MQLVPLHYVSLTEMVRSSSTVSLTDMVRSPSHVSLSEMIRSSSTVSLPSFGTFGCGGGDAEEEELGDSLRCLTLASCGLARDDAVALVDAITAGEEEGVEYTGYERLWRGNGGGQRSASSSHPPMELELADNPMLGCDGAAALVGMYK
jgi:hypothetical protein